MNFQRKTLLDMVEKSIADHHLNFDLREANRKSVYERDLKRWMNEEGPRWLTFAQEAQVTLSAGLPITKKMVPCGEGRSYGEPHLACFNATFTPETYRPDRSLLALKAMLEATTDDVVSSSHFKMKDVQRIANAYVAEIASLDDRNEDDED